MSGAKNCCIRLKKSRCWLSTILANPDHLKYYSKCEPGTIVAEYSDNHLLKKDVLVIGPDWERIMIKIL